MSLLHFESPKKNFLLFMVMRILIGMFIIRTVHKSDEAFQGPEVAHHMVFGWLLDDAGTESSRGSGRSKTRSETLFSPLCMRLGTFYWNFLVWKEGPFWFKFLLNLLKHSLELGLILCFWSWTSCTMAGKPAKFWSSLTLPAGWVSHISAGRM